MQNKLLLWVHVSLYSRIILCVLNSHDCSCDFTRPRFESPKSSLSRNVPWVPGTAKPAWCLLLHCSKKGHHFPFFPFCPSVFRDIDVTHCSSQPCTSAKWALPYTGILLPILCFLHGNWKGLFSPLSSLLDSLPQNEVTHITLITS